MKCQKWNLELKNSDKVIRDWRDWYDMEQYIQVQLAMLKKICWCGRVCGYAYNRQVRKIKIPYDTSKLWDGPSLSALACLVSSVCTLVHWQGVIDTTWSNPYLWSSYCNKSVIIFFANIRMISYTISTVYDYSDYFFLCHLKSRIYTMI